MIAEAFIMECRERGISLFLENGTLLAGGNRDAVAAALPLIRANKAAIIQHLQSEAIRQQLAPFRFRETIDTPETERINNMAWEFMQADGMTYAEAIRVAAAIVVDGNMADYEAAYEDVRALWRRITGEITNTPHASAITSQLNRPFAPKRAYQSGKFRNNGSA